MQQIARSLLKVIKRKRK